MKLHEIDIQAFSLDNPLHANVQPQLESWTGQPGGVLKLDKPTLASHAYGVAAFDKNNQSLMGYVAITTQFLPEFVKLGGLVVNPAYGRQGIGRMLTAHMLATVHDHLTQAEMIVARVNKASQNLFVKQGAIKVSPVSVYWYMGENQWG